jgi:rhamnose utilization protein RhaD (predicted bifunctional aldolase and dehydrogenase)/NAD(P)-dependent dehydrogenase (short-subunit alcohol dehydrogenase family)
MKNRWSDDEARAMVAQYAADGVNEDLALRVYTSRLLGGDPELVLHGGGNTSVKTTGRDALGNAIDVICVKGSGWDLGDIEPPGLPALRLDELRALLALDKLTDEDMVNAQRCNLLDSSAPNPSVETLLHAFLPYKFVDHTHANAVLALTDQPDGEALCRAVFGDRVTILPYIMPGFDLSQAAYAADKEAPGRDGMILLKHGIFTFGETAREAYDRMIELVSMAEDRLRAASTPITAGPEDRRWKLTPAEIAPIIRGATALRQAGGGPETARPFIVEHRQDDTIRSYVDGAESSRWSQVGVVTPDHVIRTKRTPLVVEATGVGDRAAFTEGVRAAVTAYMDAYDAYFDRHNGYQTVPRTRLDPMPRVVLVPGVGMFALGRNRKAAAVAGDLGVTTMRVVADAEAIGTFESINEAETFEMEYWSLEQAKLGRAAEPPFGGRVCVVTGGAGTIGFATARHFAKQGAAIALLDRAGSGVEERAGELGGIGIACDVTSRADVDAAFDAVCTAFGGVDIVVSNAGGAWQGRIGEVPDAVLRESFELNFFAHQNVAQRAVAIMTTQGCGGSLLFNVSKQAVNPGRDFGPYGLPKAATMALVRQYALDYGEHGIRSNGVNADRIRSGILTDEMVKSRSTARGVSEADYMGGNLLHREVTADDVADAFVDLAGASSTTGAIVTVDGGNIAAALR